MQTFRPFSGHHNCCPVPDWIHSPSEITGSAERTYCGTCGAQLAERVLTAEGTREWRGINGFSVPSPQAGLPARRLERAHTCGISPLPCYSCHRARYGGGAAIEYRRALESVA